MTFNQPKQADAATKAAITLLGADKCDGDIDPRPFSEDFSIMSENIPGCFVLMGNGVTGSHGRPLILQIMISMMSCLYKVLHIGLTSGTTIAKYFL